MEPTIYEQLDLDENRVELLMSIVSNYTVEYGTIAAVTKLMEALEDYTSREKAFAFYKLYLFIHTTEKRQAIMLELLTSEDATTDIVVESMLKLLESTGEE